jgi:DNA mismatch repair protein MutS2
MPFRVSAKCLAQLEWPDLAARLARTLRTPEALTALADFPFAPSVAAARCRLSETSEARALRGLGAELPFGMLPALGAELARLSKGGALSAAELLAVAGLARAVADTRDFFVRRAGEAPLLAESAQALSNPRPLADSIDAALDASGQVRDAASAALAAARREAREAASRVQERVERLLSERDLRAALQDAFVTMRGDRYVLPVRVEARGRVPGIVHDASASGTTLFIEPQALVELNNALKQAELAIERETRRVLAELSAQAAPAAATLTADFAVLGSLDFAFARARLAEDLDATEPVLDDGAEFELRQLRHPLLPAAEAVASDVRLGGSFHVLVISGPNAGGKTVAMKAVALAALMARAGLHVAAASGSRVGAVSAVLADIGDEQDIRESLSTFSAHLANLAAILSEAGPRSLVLLDEIGVGTDPGEGAALAQAVLEQLADAGARVLVTTHFGLLKEMAAVDPRFENACVDFDDETLAPTYRLRLGMAGASSARALAARMGMPAPVIERANSLLAREDRRLDRMLLELAASRSALERERSEALHLRSESEAARADYRAKLERLQERRDQLFASMRSELDEAFQNAHAEVAGVIRELQRGGDARAAARAREQLIALNTKTEQVEGTQRSRVPEPADAVDWRQIRPGDPVDVTGGGSGTLLALPDARGRVRVQVGSARLTLPAERVRLRSGAQSRPITPSVRVDPLPETSTPTRIDVRGSRLEEAMAAVERALDDAARAGVSRLEIIHGIGTGALMSGLRARLRELPHVARVEAGGSDTGGPGVTLAYLGRRD